MAKVICRKCGRAYDLEEWAECPTCALKEYERRKNRQIIDPFIFPNRDLTKTIKFIWG